MLLAARSVNFDLIEALTSLSASAVIILLLLLLWRGDVVLKRQHETMLEQLRTTFDAQLEQQARETMKAEADAQWWREFALDALNIADAATGREDDS